MDTRQGNLKDYQGNKIAPNTCSAAVLDEARNQGLSASLRVLVEKNALGYPTFSTVTAYAEGEVVFYDRRLYIFTAEHAAGAWDPEDVNEYSMRAFIQDVVAAIEGGSIIAGLAETLESWADDELSVEDSFTGPIRTTGGDTPILTEAGGKLVGIEPNGGDYTLAGIRTSGYNLLRLVSEGGIASAVGDGFYFPVPKLTFGTFGTAQENNGVLFTNSDHENVTPTVYFKPLADGVPASATDGTACSYHDEQGLRFYTTSGPGYLIVSGITRTDVCAHIAWEDWYDKYVPTSDEGDGGSFIDLSGLISSSPLRFISEAVKDLITVAGATATISRRVGVTTVAAADWTTEENPSEQGGTSTYTHSATISGIKSGGSACMTDGTPLDVNGTVVSFTDNNASVSEAVGVKYELASPTSSSISDIYGSGNDTYKLDDCGLEIVEGASGAGIITALYGQNIPDKLGEIARREMDETIERITDLEADKADLEAEVARLSAIDPDMKYGQPRILWGAGTPAESVVPSNWKQLADGGNNWMGKPAFVGQVYINTSVSSGGMYIGYLTSSYTLEWRQIVG